MLRFKNTDVPTGLDQLDHKSPKTFATKIAPFVLDTVTTEFFKVRIT